MKTCRVVFVYFYFPWRFVQTCAGLQKLSGSEFLMSGVYTSWESALFVRRELCDFPMGSLGPSLGKSAAAAVWGPGFHVQVSEA